METPDFRALALTIASMTAESIYHLEQEVRMYPETLDDVVEQLRLLWEQGVAAGRHDHESSAP